MKNYVNDGNKVTITGPTGGLLSGAPYVLGKIPLVADGDIAQGATGACSTRGRFSLSVKGWNGSANAAIAQGDLIYYKTGQTPPLNVDTSGVAFGKVLTAITSGATATVDVLVIG